MDSRVVLGVILFVICHASLVEGYGSGAPSTSCVTMTPGHLNPNNEPINPSSDPSPYSLAVDKTMVRIGGTVRVTINHVNGVTFRGFLLQARLAADGSSTVPIGTFSTSVENTKTTTCTATDDSVTHENTEIKPEGMAVTWMAPSTEFGDIKFVATVAENHDVFWVGHESSTVSYDPTGQFTCPTWFAPWGRKCYYFQGAHQSLALAEHTCRAVNRDALPVLVESQAEGDFLKGKLKEHDPATHEGFWLRCKDDTTEGQWTCDSSSNYWNSAGDNLGFWDWRNGEPGGDTDENCLVIDFDGKLRSVLCQLLLSFNAAACELTMVTAPTVTPAPTGPSENSTEEPEPTTQSDHTCPTWFEPWDRNCYYFQGAHQSLALAEHTCTAVNMEALPVVVESQAEADFLKDKLNADFNPATHDGFWLRCTDNTTEGKWTCDNSTNYWNSTEDNQGFWDWRNGEPAGDPDKNCLVIDFDGKLRDVPCQLYFSFNAAACEIGSSASWIVPSLSAMMSLLVVVFALYY
ncbi:uncharacterized protein [Amphiura filiformis]|uniref:uncharacterized protein n=1 Tax=Amphiura filiformis TaxID=82378 RepID=UPI003B2259C9